MKESSMEKYPWQEKEGTQVANVDSLDITGADDVEIVIKEDGKVVWVNSPLCVLRICQIRGRITVRDGRSRRSKKMAN
jgi:hypothetical protein